MSFTLSPPHLTAAVYPSGDERDAFAAVCGVLRRQGAEDAGRVEVVGQDQEFILRSDLAGVSRVVTDLDAALLDRAERPVRAAFRDRRENLVVEYLMAPSGDRHPIGVSMSAGPLGMPSFVADAETKRAARALAKKTKKLLMEMVRATRPWYAEVDVEHSLPTPRELDSGAAVVGPDFYLCQALLHDDQLSGILRDDLADAAAVDWPGGRSYSLQAASAKPDRRRRLSRTLGRLVTRPG